MNEMFDAARVKTILEETLSLVLAEMAFLDCVATGTPNSQILEGLNHCVAIDEIGRAHV